MSKTKVYWKDELDVWRVQRKLRLEEGLKVVIMRALFDGASWEDALEESCEYLIEENFDRAAAVSFRNNALKELL